MKILVVGGYGTFGGRLVDLLADESRLEILVAGRSEQRAADFCGRRNARARLTPTAFDRNTDVSQQVRALAPDVLVDASGPFQSYGARRYELIEACIAQRVHYLDLADGADFVAGVSNFDSAARSAGISVLSGVSSFPVLTASVVRRLSVGMTRVTSIRGGIAPSPYSGVGANVLRAIASYAGKPVRRGAITIGYGFTGSCRFTIAPPGKIPLRNTLFSLVDVPDVRALPELWPDADEIWMGAGPVPEVLHRALVACAWFVRCRLLPSLSPFAGLMSLVVNKLRWGEHRGGMFVEVRGTDEQHRDVNRSWHLLAEGNDGPFIPSMAIEALIRKMLTGQQPAAGARAAVRDLELTDYEALFASRTIYTGERDDRRVAAAPLFERLLGAAWHTLPDAVRRLHTFESEHEVRGRCTVERGRGLLSNIVAFLVRFPPAGTDVPVSVRFRSENGNERWIRRFGHHRFASTMLTGRGRSERLLSERIGPIDFAQALVVDGDRLRLIPRRWSIFGIPLPLWLAPRADAYETEENGRFRFHVHISHPWMGLIVRYRGWLE
ncbi:MAG: DUF4166 domain-containing protein [Proteobacteria bacterium]|nr:DUF4166 domain-containing protein [Pseudomonadota bacterium]